jgi:peptide deformylase
MALFGKLLMEYPLMLVDENDTILRQPCPLYDFSTNEDLDLMYLEMLRVMNEHSGIGLAAPQVGISSRIFIFGDPAVLVINPEVIAQHGELSFMREGCLSFPGLYLNIKRYSKIDVRYQNIKGEIIEDRLDGLMARCFNHETDHVDGIVFTARAAKLSLKLALAKRKVLMQGRY